MRFLIIFIFLITNVVAEELPGIKNIVIHKIPKTYDNVIFLDKKDQKINKEITNNKFEFNKKYEDIHINIEKRLFQIIGEEAGYVHTGRSRNDQVITDFKTVSYTHLTLPTMDHV